jgi:hypothetical protein
LIAFFEYKPFRAALDFSFVDVNKHAVLYGMVTGTALKNCGRERESFAPSGAFMVLPAFPRFHRGLLRHAAPQLKTDFEIGSMACAAFIITIFINESWIGGE